MARTLTPERTANAITLRKQGWTEQAIADQIGIPRTTVEGWLIKTFDDNATLGKTVKSWDIDDKPRYPNIVKNLYFDRFLGKIEDLKDCTNSTRNYGK